MHQVAQQDGQAGRIVVFIATDRGMAVDHTQHALISSVVCCTAPAVTQPVFSGLLPEPRCVSEGSFIPENRKSRAMAVGDDRVDV
ncbi:hypothetical protein D9M72_589500 [compost metagenome]